MQLTIRSILTALALSGVAAAQQQQFIVPPDANYIDWTAPPLVFAYGDTFQAEWWTDWDYVTLDIVFCSQKQTENVFTDQQNANTYPVFLDKALQAGQSCNDFALRITKVPHGNEDGAIGPINSEAFNITAEANPSITIGAAATQTVTGYSSAGTSQAVWTSTIVDVISVSHQPGYDTTSSTSAVTTTDPGTSPTDSASSFSISSPDPGSSEDNAAGGQSLSSSQKTALGVGLGLGIPLAVATVVGAIVLLAWRRRRSITSDAYNKFGTEVRADEVAENKTRPV